MVRTRGVFVLRVLRTFRHRSALSAPRSTNLWLRNNSPDGKRSHMTAFVSDDDGATWKGGLLLDERESSYPDGIQAEDGTLFIIDDHQRDTLNRASKRAPYRLPCLAKKPFGQHAQFYLPSVPLALPVLHPAV